MTSQLTEREAALYTRAHRDAYDDLIAELRRQAASLEDQSAADDRPVDDRVVLEEARVRLVNALVAARDREIRITGSVDELPPAPCGVESAYAGVPVLCGYPAGHLVDGETRRDTTLSDAGAIPFSDFHHSWEILPAWPPTPAPEEPEEDMVAVLVSELAAELGARFVRRTWSDFLYDAVARFRARGT